MVKPGETFYSLSRRFGITEEQLGSLNGGLKPADLKAGAIIKVPGSPEELAAGERQPADTVRADSVPDLSAEQQGEGDRIPAHCAGVRRSTSP